MKEENKKIVLYKIKYRNKWWHPFANEKIVRISLCEHNWVEIAKGQFKRKQYDNYDRCIGSNCIGDTITLKCKKCGEIKTIGVDIIR